MTKEKAKNVRVAISMAVAAVVIALMISVPVFLMRNWKTSPGAGEGVKTVQQTTSTYGQGDLVEKVAARDEGLVQAQEKVMEVWGGIKKIHLSPGKMDIESMILAKNGTVTVTGSSMKDLDSVPGGYKLVGVEALANNIKESYSGRKITITATESASGEAYDFQIVVLP